MAHIAPASDFHRQPHIGFNDKNIFEIEDTLFNIFKFLPSREEIATLSLVNRFWYQVSSQPYVWLPLCQQKGVPFPSKKNYQYQCESLLLEKIRICHEPFIQEIALEIDLQNYPHIDFVENSHFIARNDFVICICCVSKGKLVKKIVTESKILSLCTSQSEIYVFLANGLIDAYHLKDVAESPFLQMNASVEDLKNEQSHSEEVQLFANHEWLFSHAFGYIRQWDRLTGKRIISRPLQDKINILQTVQDKIYALTHDSHFNLDCLITIDLKNGQFEIKIDNIKNLPSNASSLSLNHPEFLYLREMPPPLSYRSLSSSDKELNDTKVKIVKIDLDNALWSFIPIHSVGRMHSAYLKTFRDVAILVYDPDSDVSENQIDRPPNKDVIEVIDLQTQEVKHRFSNHTLLSKSNNHWSVTIFHDTIVYVTADNKIVTITFSKKRKLNAHETETAQKRIKIN